MMPETNTLDECKRTANEKVTRLTGVARLQSLVVWMRIYDDDETAHSYVETLVDLQLNGTTKQLENVAVPDVVDASGQQATHCTEQKEQEEEVEKDYGGAPSGSVLGVAGGKMRA